MTEVNDESQAYEYAEPLVLALAEEARSSPPVPLVDRKAQIRIAMKQMGTKIDLAMKRYLRLLGCIYKNGT